MRRRSDALANDAAGPARGADGGPRVVVIGAGFAGLSAISRLANSGARVTLVDRNVYSTFQPLLYQVATAGLTSADVAYPNWAAVRKPGAHFRKGEVTGIDAGARRVLLADKPPIEYDYLIIATGVSAAFFDVPGAAEHAFSLYTRRDAIVLRDYLVSRLEFLNEAPGDREFNITIVGGGPTGVELAGTLAELRNIALPASFPEIDRDRMRISLIELGPSLLAPFRESLREYARRELVSRGVDVRLDTEIKQVQPDQVLIARPGEAGPGATGLDGATELRSDLTVWAAGIGAPEWVGKLGLPTGHGGRVRTGPDLRVAGQDRVFAVGDIALIEDQPLAQLAQPAIQQGRHAATQIRRLEAGQPVQPFRYKDKGIMATIGRRSAVAQLPGRIRVKGTLAWLGWLALHLFTLLGGRNRISALVNLSWRYLTWSRGGGVLVGDDSPPGKGPAP